MKEIANRRWLIAGIAVVVGCWIVGGVALWIWLGQREPGPLGNGVFITSTNFGLVQSDGSIVATERIPRQPGVSYGWSLYVHPESEVTRIREVFRLAEGGRFDGERPAKDNELKLIDYKISEDGREKTEDYEVRSRRAFTIREQYTVSNDDPAGQYEIALYVDETEVARFGFEVVDEELRN